MSAEEAASAVTESESGAGAGAGAGVGDGPRTGEKKGPVTFTPATHIRYFLVHSQHLPEEYMSIDTNRMTALHFSVTALDLFGMLEHPALKRDAIIDWVYAMQVPASAVGDRPEAAGFLGGSFTGRPFHVPGESFRGLHDAGHLAMTYTALSILTALGDDLSRVDKAGILAGLRALQRPDGCFNAVATGSEHDMRFLYCACAISAFLGDWSGVDTDRAMAYIRSCQTFDGVFCLIPNQESHGGSTYCALASMQLMGRLGELERRDDAVHWLVERQVSGFQGRPNKVPDSCYSFWNGGSLAILDAAHFINGPQLAKFLLRCQHPHYGAFTKHADDEDPPDILHAFFGLCGMALIQQPDVPVAKLNAALGVSQRVADLVAARTRRTEEAEGEGEAAGGEDKDTVAETTSES